MSDETLGPTLSRPARSAARATPSAARLTIVHPPHARVVIDLASEPCTLGRRAAGPSPGLRDATVSRAHCRVEWDAARGTHTVVDLGSRNGTRLNTHAIDADADAVELTDNAVLRIGDVFAVYERWPAQERSLTRSLTESRVDRDAIPGRSRAACLLRAAIEQAATDPSPALILGPTGVGKEFVAAELHRLSGRRGPLVPFNCAALSPQLAESQLFGHVRGAFTGADRASPGLFRSAQRGTVFLDEIGEMDLTLQPKLLRAIQAREVQPVGQSTPVSVDARVIAATHAALADRVEAGTFRRDLYARLALWEIRVPGLAERRADLFAWFERLHQQWCQQRDQQPRPILFSPDAVSRMLAAAWPDNLRGLDRLVHQVARDVDVVDLPHVEHLRAAPTIEPPRPARPPKPSRAALIAALEANQGSVRAIAKLYQRDRKQIYRWMAAYGLKDE